jgi:hypothetical protein
MKFVGLLVLSDAYIRTIAYYSRGFVFRSALVLVTILLIKL